VSLSSNQEKEYAISLYNQYGQLLASKKTLCRKGINQISWNMNNYSNGVYYLVFENKELENIKIIKQ
jgi:glutamate formiminotransferase